MTRPWWKQARSDGRIFDAQVRALHGMRSRLGKLKESWSSDLSILNQQQSELKSSFQLQVESEIAKQSERLHQEITRWDVDLDKTIAAAERDFLHSVQFEKSERDRLLVKLNQSKATLKTERENGLKRLAQLLEDGRTHATQTRDSVRAKLETERRTVNNTVHEAEDWVLLKVGRTFQNIQQNESSFNEGQRKEVTDLAHLAKCIEEGKRSLNTSIQRMKNQSQVRWLSSMTFHSLGVLLAWTISAVCWAAAVPILIVVLIATVGAILLTAIVHYATRPLVARAILKSVPELMATEKELYDLIAQGGRIAESYCQLEITKAIQQHQTSVESLENEFLQNRDKMLRKYETDCETLRVESLQKRYDLVANRKSAHAATNQAMAPMIENLKRDHKSLNLKMQKEFESRAKSIENQFYSKQARSISRWKKGGEQTAIRMKGLLSGLSETQPAWNSSVYENGNWVRSPESLAWRLGISCPDRPLSDEAATYSNELKLKDASWPILFDLLSDGALVLSGNAANEPTLDGVMQNVLLRGITSLPAGSLQVTIVDPQGLGKKFSWLMSLTDIDPHLVDDRVWTQPLHIADRLALIARHVEDVIQQSLRDQYSDLYQYNLHAGPMAIPYRLIIWDQFPFGLDDTSWQALCSILASGARCGVGVILRTSSTQVWPSYVDIRKLKEFGKSLRVVANNPNRLVLEHPMFESSEIETETPPTQEEIQTIMKHHFEDVSDVGKMVVPFEQIQLSESERQASSAANDLSIPIGISNSGRIQSLKLGVGTAQHVLVAGKTGSGKSSLLHTLITSAATKYSPDELRLVLLDFKKGVEFQVYSESELSHADIIGIESKREFGVSTLEYLDRVMHARGEAFREWGVQDLPSLARKHPNVKMPRILVVIDEFQELFVEDDKLSQQASMLMDRIVRQGRSFGMHLVLASQTLGGAYSLPRTTLAQMAIRIALQCDSSDAMLILSEDNTAAERLRHSGQAIYNDGGGRFEANQGFQVAYLAKEDQLRLLDEIPKQPVPHSPTTNALGRRIVFEGHKPALWDSTMIERAWTAGGNIEMGAYNIVLGESISIDPPVIKRISRIAGRSGAIVGNDEGCAASVLASCIAGFLMTQNNANADRKEAIDFEAGMTEPGVPCVQLLNGARPEDTKLTELVQRVDPKRVRVVAPREIENALSELHRELKKRLDDSNEIYPSRLLCVSNLSRFRELRKGDEFSFGDEGDNARPDAMFADLLRDGPTVGLFTWIWADSAGTLTRWLSRQSLRDLELRILMQMSSADSNQLIDSNAANKLEPHVALLQDDLDGKPIKFRPFALETVPLQ